MAKTITVPLREYTAGTYEVELNTLPGNSTGAEFIMTRNSLPGSPTEAVAHVDVYTSMDNGASWFHEMGMDIPGGVLYDRNGDVLPASRMSMTWQGVADQNGNRVALRGSDVRLVSSRLPDLFNRDNHQ